MAKLKDEFRELEAAASAADLWEDQQRAQGTLQQMSDLRATIEEVEGFWATLADVQTAVELAQLEVFLQLLLLSSHAWSKGFTK